MGFEHQIKPGLPGFALVDGGDADLPDAAFHGYPRTTREYLLTRDDLSSSQHHLSSLKISLDDEQLAAIGHPTLVPGFSGSIVDAETLTSLPGCVLIVLMHDAAIEQAGNADPCRGRWAVVLEGVPIPQPEIELPVFRRRAGRRVGKIRQRNRSGVFAFDFRAF